ncbi:MAG: acyltransferase family protein, partial [Parabacteroides sp.]
MSHSDLQSDTIHFLRFPLIVGVVFIHAHLSSDFVNITASDYPVFYVVNEFVSNILVRVSVPLFFFFSGFLFYYKTDFNGITYAKKVKSRIQSLLIPYLIWNIFLLALYYFVQKIPDINALFSGEKERIADFSVVDYLHAFGIGSD